MNRLRCLLTKLTHLKNYTSIYPNMLKKITNRGVICIFRHFVLGLTFSYDVCPLVCFENIMFNSTEQKNL